MLIISASAKLCNYTNSNPLPLDGGKERQPKEERAVNSPVIDFARAESGKKTQFEMLLSQNESME